MDSLGKGHTGAIYSATRSGCRNRAERAALISACARQPRGHDQNENKKASKTWTYGFGHWTWLHDDECSRNGNDGSIFIGEMFFDAI